MNSTVHASCALQSAQCNALAPLLAEQQGWQSWMRHCSLSSFNGSPAGLAWLHCHMLSVVLLQPGRVS